MKTVKVRRETTFRYMKDGSLSLYVVHECIYVFVCELCMFVCVCCQDGIVRRHAMENDETYYLWCLHFFMEFSRNHAFRVDLVG